MKKIYTLLMILILTACTFDKAPPDNIRDDQIYINNNSLIEENTSVTIQETPEQIEEVESEEEKKGIIFPDIDYSSLPTQDIEFDSIKLFQKPIKLESYDAVKYTELGLVTEGKYKGYIFGNSSFAGQFSDGKTYFYLREPNQEKLYYISEPAWSLEEDRLSISDFNIPSLEFEEETISYKGNDLVTDGTLYYNEYLLSKIRNYEKIQSEEASYTLYKKGWAFYRIIQDDFYILYQYSPIDKELSSILRSMSNFEQEDYFSYLLMDKFSTGEIHTIATGYMGLYDDLGVIQGQTNMLNFDNLEQIHDGSDLDLYIVKEFLDGEGYESKVLNEVLQQFIENQEFFENFWRNDPERLQEIKQRQKYPKDISKDEFLSIKPVLIQTDNMGEFSVYIRSDIIPPFDA